MEDPHLNGGPSVGIEDSKFLMESSLNQHSLSVPQDSKFSAPHDISQSAMKDESPEAIKVKTTNMGSPQHH